MGHIRVGRLPKIRGWKQVVFLLDSHESSASEIATATAKAAKQFFSQNKTDSVLVFSYWLATQITYRARFESFEEELEKIGLDIRDVETPLDFLAKVANFARAESKSRGATFPLSEFAQLSLREVLTETIGWQSQTLFGQTRDDIRIACRRYSSPQQFSKLARLYFSKVLNRTLQFFLGKETANKVGSSRKFRDISDLSSFEAAIESYCYQSARIIQDFAEGWYSKRNWQGGISEMDAKGFVAVAIEKLADEIAHEDRPTEDRE